MNYEINTCKNIMNAIIQIDQGIEISQILTKVDKQNLDNKLQPRLATIHRRIHNNPQFQGQAAST